MNAEVERFLRETIRSSLQLEIVLYFHQNPFTMDYAEGTAMRLGYHPHLVEEALERLTEQGVLQKRVSQFAPDRPPVYSYTRDRTVRAMVEQVARLMADTKSRTTVMKTLQATAEEA